jgi:hypothetical protein
LPHFSGYDNFSGYQATPLYLVVPTEIPKEPIFVLTLGTVGLLLIIMGVLIRIGRHKRWYLVDDNSMFYHKAVYYAFIPMGLASMFLAALPLLPTGGSGQDLVTYAFFLLMGIGVLLTFWQPRWLKPDWVCWLEENHTDILDLLIKEARKTSGWEQRVSTQTGLEQWVVEIRQKHDLLPGVAPTVKEQGRSWLRRQWPIGLVIVAVSSGVGQYLLGNGFIGFIGGWAILGIIYLLRPKE